MILFLDFKYKNNTKFKSTLLQQDLFAKHQ